MTLACLLSPVPRPTAGGPDLLNRVGEGSDVTSLISLGESVPLLCPECLSFQRKETRRVWDKPTFGQVSYVGKDPPPTRSAGPHEKPMSSTTPPPFSPSLTVSIGPQTSDGYGIRWVVAGPGFMDLSVRLGRVVYFP